MFQEDRLLENLSVRANIMLRHSQAHTRAKANARERITEALCAVGLGGMQQQACKRTSGGQKDALLFAHTLCRCRVLLFDEPLGD